MLPLASKIGPQRTTKNAQKLKLLPNPDPGEDGPDEESGRDVYSQFTRIKDPTARRDAARLGKADRDKLPRVTAYCTASSYRIPGLMRYLKSRGRTRGANPKQFDECIYSPFDYNSTRLKAARQQEPNDPPDLLIDENEIPHNRERRYSDSALEVEENKQHHREDLIDLTTSAGDTTLDNGEPSLPNHTLTELNGSRNGISSIDFDTEVHTPEAFLFEYGTVVIWGMTLQEEERFLKEISKFEAEKLGADDVETENFNFYYTSQYQARIYNDFISLREKKNYMTKLAISHALSQSVKTSLFEDLLTTTITLTSPLPAEIAMTGSISLNRKEIHQQIGQLFILRINIHLQGSVLDSPELMWAEPSLEPVYAAVRSYLEMDQRVGLLTERLSVIGDLLAVLKDQVGTKHGEYLEWIGKSTFSCRSPMNSIADFSSQSSSSLQPRSWSLRSTLSWICMLASSDTPFHNRAWKHLKESASVDVTQLGNAGACTLLQTTGMHLSARALPLRCTLSSARKMVPVYISKFEHPIRTYVEAIGASAGMRVVIVNKEDLSRRLLNALYYCIGVSINYCAHEWSRIWMVA